jgi:formylmethanofuran dehydrogenase subunit E
MEKVEITERECGECYSFANFVSGGECDILYDRVKSTPEIYDSAMDNFDNQLRENDCKAFIKKDERKNKRCGRKIKILSCKVCGKDIERNEPKLRKRNGDVVCIPCTGKTVEEDV